MAQDDEMEKRMKRVIDVLGRSLREMGAPEVLDRERDGRFEAWRKGQMQRRAERRQRTRTKGRRPDRDR